MYHIKAKHKEKVYQIKQVFFVVQLIEVLCHANKGREPEK